jgi:hypothetical protein
MNRSKNFISCCVLLCCVQFVFSQGKTEVNKQCSLLASNLIPSGEIKKGFAKILDETFSGKDKTLELEIKELDSNLSDIIVNKFYWDEKISIKRKDILLSKIPTLKKQIYRLIKQELLKSLVVSEWIEQSSQKNCPQLFSLDEVKKINTLFQSRKGQKIIVSNKIIISVFTKQKPVFSASEENVLNELNEFVNTSLGERLYKTFWLERVSQDISNNIANWSK